MGIISKRRQKRVTGKRKINVCRFYWDFMLKAVFQVREALFAILCTLHCHPADVADAVRILLRE